ncbi:MAG TPA: DUF2157 domain-containing protein [Negativicutes bacterium]|nr:DUF2157 domain-containing protein [Negativicutes bacterium]
MTDEKLREAIERGIITPAQAEQLWQLWQSEDAGPVSSVPPVLPAEPKGDALSHFLYYLGSLIVISAMGWLMNTAWESFRGMGLFLIATAYAAVFCGAARYLREKSVVLSGLFVVMAVCMTPMAVFGLQSEWGVWPFKEPGRYQSYYHYIRGGWFPMELATLAAGIVSLRYSKIPFAMAPIAFTLWFMSMDVAPVIAGGEYSKDLRQTVSVVFGLFMIGAAIWVDRRSRIDYAKWLYIFGAITFWGGLSLMRSSSELSKFIYCLINVGFMFTGILLERRVFVVLGGFGFFGYLGHLSWKVFAKSFVFPFVLTALGLLVVYSGWIYHKKYEAVQRFVNLLTPEAIRNMLPRNRPQK